MEKLYEQTQWLMNPQPDRRKRGRMAMQSWPAGTRWKVQARYTSINGDYDGLEGVDSKGLSDLIIENSKEVEPGFAVSVSKHEYEDIIGRLIDMGKITMADIEKALNAQERFDYESASEEEIANYHKRYRLEEMQFRYRHGIDLDPPSAELICQVAEQERQDNIRKEYAERTGGWNCYRNQDVVQSERG